MPKSKTAKAADKAVEKSQVKQKIERTPDQIVADIRKNLDAHLAVTSADIRVLLAAHDLLNDGVATAAKLIQALKNENDRLTAQVEEFRKVYEQENRNMSFRVEESLDDRTVLATDASSAVALGEMTSETFLNRAVTATASAISKSAASDSEAA